MPKFIWRRLRKKPENTTLYFQLPRELGPTEKKALGTVGSNPIMILNHIRLLFLEY